MTNPTKSQAMHRITATGLMSLAIAEQWLTKRADMVAPICEAADSAAVAALVRGRADQEVDERNTPQVARETLAAPDDDTDIFPEDA